MKEVSQEFLNKLTDEELCEIFIDGEKWVDRQLTSDYLIWKLCDRHEEEFGVNIDLMDMDRAVLYEIGSRFVKLIKEE